MRVLSSLAGGAMIGASASLLLLFNGRVAGISGVLSGALERTPEAHWRRLFVAGLVAGGLVLRFALPSALPSPDTSLLRAIAAGLLVGFGARLGGGCTSGHGVCGIARLSVPSVVSTLTFMATGMLATGVVCHLLGAPR